MAANRKQVDELLSAVPRQQKIKRSEYLDSGRFPIVDQSQAAISGYTDDPDWLYTGELPVIVFGDHTRILKFVDFPFCVGADGTQLLRPVQGVDILYFYYALRNLDLESYGYERHFKYLKKETVEIPEYDAQRRIASILSAYDDLIENSQRRIKILESMARALYREWFVHFRFPGHESVPRVPSAMGEIPQGWEVKKLGEFASITMGLSPKGNSYNEDGDGTPLVNGPVEFGERFTKRVKWTTAPSKFCKEGDLVVCVRGSTTGKFVKSDGWYCLGRGVCGISCKYQCFVDLLFENELPKLLGQTSGSTFPSWTGPQLKGYPVLVPTSALLERFETLVRPISAAILDYSRQVQNLRRTRDVLLPRLLSSQINVEALAHA